MTNKLSSLSILQKEELFRKLRVSITHHSNAIEGGTLSFGETKALLEKGTTANNKSLSEQLVVLGFAKAYDVIIREATNQNNTIDVNFIKDLHQIMFEGALRMTPTQIDKPIGAYRKDERYIKGSDIVLSAPSKISQSLENLLYEYPSNKMDLNSIADFHIKFEIIHPFADGNGRIGRLLMAFQSIQNDIIPPLIEITQRNNYLLSLNNKEGLSDFLKKAIEKSKNEITIKQQSQGMER